ncbi:MAG: response regulator [Bacteroidales bacterium]|nr:response regulator [Bacteroidales bacterium]
MRAELKTEKQTREKQEALNEERMRFYTNAAHEIRTPLSLIAGPLEDLATDKNLDETVAQKINLINRNSRKLLSLVNNLLDLRKTETANFQLRVTKGYLNRTVGSLTVNYRELNQNREVEILYNCSQGDYEMYFDNQCITTILNNLLSNSLKYTPKGYIKVSLSQNGDTAVLSVEDTGYGISKNALPKIFDRYFQERGTHQASGTGIGLSLVKSLVELHKGTIAVESTLGQGTKFIIEIPSLKEAAAPEEKAEEALTTEDPKNQKPIVLVVEDNADILEYVKMALTEKYSVLTASDGEAGIITAIEKTPEIVVSDIMMPVKDGIELCKTLKNDLRTSHIPIILLTAKDSLEDKTEGYVSGADSYITKPFSASLLKSRIENLLEKKRQLAGYFSAQSTSQKFLEGLSATDAEFMKKIDALIEENLGNSEFSVATVCKKMCISSSTLYRKIKALTLISANEYIKKFRVRKAAAFLEEGRYTISEIVFKVGFGSTDYFRDCFKEEYGVSPSEYIKKIRNK